MKKEKYFDPKGCGKRFCEDCLADWYLTDVGSGHHMRANHRMCKECKKREQTISKKLLMKVQCTMFLIFLAILAIVGIVVVFVVVI